MEGIGFDLRSDPLKIYGLTALTSCYPYLYELTPYIQPYTFYSTLNILVVFDTFFSHAYNYKVIP